MYNNNKHCGVQRQGFRTLVTVGMLLGGVVCGFALSAISTTDTHKIVPMGQPFGVLVDLDTKAAQQADAGVDGTLSNDSLPEEAAETDTDVSAGFRLVLKTVQAELRESRPSYALKLLVADPMAKKLKNNEFDRIKAVIAQSYLMEGKIDKAEKVASEAVKRSGEDAPLAGWVAGQAAWRNQNFAKAADMFGVAAQSSTASVWLASGAAYWAGRAAARDGQKEDAKEWYQLAAQHPRTFYGLISLRILGEDIKFNWDVPPLERSVKRSLDKDLKVTAALRLSREGNLSAAITSLGSTKWMRNDAGRRALLAYFLDKSDPALALFMGRKTRDENGRFYDAALYPESPWAPKTGYEVDKALIHALIRQESRFNPHAVSRTGATGLMQIMPATAEDIAFEESDSLSHPETNITIGQKYVKQLLRDKSVNNDLFRMAIAYNAGPGNLSRWTSELKAMNDPMLFIESIPSGETRAFVERVMVNYWIYSLRMGKDVPSLDAVAMLDHPDSVDVASRNPAAEDRPAMFSNQLAMAQ